MAKEHNTITDPEVHEPKDITTAPEGTTYVADGVGSGSWIGLAGATVVIISAESDFPTPVGGIITLAADTTYVIAADVTTANRFVIGNNVTLRGSLFNSVLTYTGTDSMLSCTDVNFNVDNINLDCPSGTLFDIRDSVGGVNRIILQGLNVDNCASGGTIDNVRTLFLREFILSNATQGIKLLGPDIKIFSFSNAVMASTSATFIGIDLNTSVIVNTQISNSVFSGPAGSIGLKGLINSGNLPVGQISSVTRLNFAAAMTALSGITPSDVRWEFLGNSGINDSSKAGDVSLSTQETVTITTAGVFVDIGGVNWTTDVLTRFTGTTAGVLTYISERDGCFLVLGNATVSKVGGGSDQIAMRIAVNGTSLAKSQSVTQSSDPTSVANQALTDLAETDTISLQVANLTSTSNVIVDVSDLTITRSG